MRDDPQDIAEHLIQEHGVEGALERATEEITAAQEQGDNYGPQHLAGGEVHLTRARARQLGWDRLDAR